MRHTHEWSSSADFAQQSFTDAGMRVQDHQVHFTTLQAPRSQLLLNRPSCDEHPLCCRFVLLPGPCLGLEMAPTGATTRGLMQHKETEPNSQTKHPTTGPSAPPSLFLILLSPLHSQLFAGQRAETKTPSLAPRFHARFDASSETPIAHSATLAEMRRSGSILACRGSGLCARVTGAVCASWQAKNRSHNSG